MASYLSYRNVLLNNSTVIASTLNAGSVSYSTLTGSTMSTRAVTASTLNAGSVSYSTLTGSTMSTRAVTASTLTGSTITISTLSGSTIFVSTLSGSTINVSTLSGSTINVSTLSGSTINVSTLTGSTIQATTVFFSTMTASTILTAGSTINLARNVNVPNRFVEVGCDLADSMYLDFHSKDSTLPDYSTRIISQGGATNGQGALNMYASTMGIMATNGVGIGTTNPQNTLHVHNSTADSTQAPEYNSTSGQIVLTNTKSGTTRYSMAIGMDQALGIGYLNAAGNGTHQPICLNTRGGNVGIGTTNPASLLTVCGSGSAASASTTLFLDTTASVTTGEGQIGILHFANNGTIGASIQCGLDVGGANNNGTLRFYTRQDYVTYGERMRITRTGNVLIGTSATPYYNPRLTVTNTGGNEVININSDNPGYNFIRFNTTATIASGTSILYATFYNNGSAIGQIVGNGSGTVAYNSGSDARIKKNIDYNFNGMNIINQLKPAAFSMLPDMSNTIYHGFIAQDVLPLYPQYVTTSSDGRYSMDYSKFSGIIVKGIQEQQTTITNLQSQVTAQSAQLDAQASAIAALEARLAALEAK